MAQVKKMPRSKNFYFTIYDFINRFSKLPTDKDLQLTKQARNYYIKGLKKAKIIERIAYGTWQIIGDYDLSKIKTSKKIAIGNLNNHSLKPDTIRAHAFMWHLRIPILSKWDKRREYLEKEGITYTKLGNLGEGERIIFRGRKVHLKNKCIIIYDKESYLSEKAKDAKSSAIYEFLSLVKGLEGMLRTDLTINKQYRFKVCREHYALIKNALAKQYDKEGKKLYVYSDKGLWMVIDNSLNLHELEAVKLGEAIGDSVGMQEWANSMKETGFKVTPTFILNALDQLIKDRQYYAENLKSHVEAIKQLGEAVKELKKGNNGDF